jgi:hypothetical protein
MPGLIKATDSNYVLPAQLQKPQQVLVVLRHVAAGLGEPCNVSVSCGVAEVEARATFGEPASLLTVEFPDGRAHQVGVTDDEWRRGKVLAREIVAMVREEMRS